MKKTKLSGIERQDEYIKSLEKKGFDFGLVIADAFVRGMRDIGYKSTATAVAEIYDNGIQAGATSMHTVFGFNQGKSGKSDPDQIAIIDNGYGMQQKMIRASVLWGGSDRLGNREGMGKYGYGLPSSCVSIGERFTVYSLREDIGKWYSVTMDLQEISSGDPKYVNPKTNGIWAPPAELATLPSFVQDYMKDNKIKLKSGTVVVIDKIDKLDFQTTSRLTSFLVQQAGIIYRNYLNHTEMFINGEKVKPIDPLFITEGYEFFDEDDDRAKPLPPLEIPVKGIGTIKARFSLMPPTFLRTPEDKLKERGKNNNRFFIRKDNNGIIVTRAGRQIDVVNSKCPWTTFQNNDRYIGIELDFPPTLDEYFSITTAKQQVVLKSNLWDILYDNGVYEIISEMRKMFTKSHSEVKARIAEQTTQNEEDKVEFVEKVMQLAAKNFEVAEEFETAELKREATEQLDKEAKKTATEIGVDEGIVKQALEAKYSNKPFAVEFIYEEEGNFYRAKRIGGQLVLYINKAHRFYTDLYDNKQTTPFFKTCINYCFILPCT